MNEQSNQKEVDRNRAPPWKYWAVVQEDNRFGQILEEEQKRRRNVERKKRGRNSGTKSIHTSKFWRGTKATIVLALSLAEEVGDLIVGADRAFSNRESGKNEYSYVTPTTIVGRVYTQVSPIYYGCR